MAVALRASGKRKYAEILDFFTAEEVQNNVTFLMLANHLIKRSLEPETEIIKVIDQEDENNVLYYTNEKFLEVIDMYGLDGFIY